MASRVGRWPTFLVCCLLGVFSFDTIAAKESRIDPAGITGTLYLCGGGKLPDSIRESFVRRARGSKGKLVLIPTASERADRLDEEDLRAAWKEFELGSIAVLHTRDRNKANEDEFVSPLKEATAVWFGGGSQKRIADAYLGTKVEKELHALLERGGVIGGTSAGAAIMSKVMIASGTDKAKLETGFDFLPGAVVDQHFKARKREKRLLGVLADKPGLFGVGIDEGTALVVRGRSLRVLGESTVTLALAAGGGREVRTQDINARSRADLTTWRRAALARTEKPFPPRELGTPEVKKGSLVIVGGGGMPRSVTKKFIELAGGPEALIVVLPTAMPDPIPPGSGASFFLRAGAKNVKVLPARKLEDVEDPKNLEILKKAKGVWFGGGRQWRFVDAYEGTKAHELFFDVLRRGGVIGGSSAGASIQGEYLCRPDPLGNRNIICEGYERGLGFLPGVGIDQHFSQRRRLPDMTELKEAYPQLLGIGIDEATAIVVKGTVAEVMGRNRVLFYGRTTPAKPDEDEYVVGKVGQKYDLKERKLIEDDEKDKTEKD